MISYINGRNREYKKALSYAVDSFKYTMTFSQLKNLIKLPFAVILSDSKIVSKILPVIEIGI